MSEETTANNIPIFQTIFGDRWDELPPLMKKHHAVRPYSDDRVKVEGRLDVAISPFVSLMARRFWCRDITPINQMESWLRG